MTYRSEPPTPWWMWPLGILFIALCVLAYAGWAEWLHGDWRCAFAQCRIETK